MYIQTCYHKELYGPRWKMILEVTTREWSHHPKVYLFILCLMHAVAPAALTLHKRNNKEGGQTGE